MDFAGYIEAIIGSASIWFRTSITKDGVKFYTMNHSMLEDAFKYLEEYDKQMAIERETKHQAELDLEQIR